MLKMATAANPIVRTWGHSPCWRRSYDLFDHTTCIIAFTFNNAHAKLIAGCRKGHKDCLRADARKTVSSIDDLFDSHFIKITDCDRRVSILWGPENI